MEEIPRDVFTDIVRYSSISTLAVLSQTDKKLSAYINHPSVLRELAIARGLPLAFSVRDLATYEGLNPSHMLTAAVETGDLRVAEALFRSGVTSYDSQLVMYAIANGNADMLRLVLEYGTLINISTGRAFTEAKNNPALIEVLMDYDVEFTLYDVGRLPRDPALFQQLLRTKSARLVRAVLARACKIGLIKQLIIPPSVNRREDLEVAVVYECVPLVRILVARGVEATPEIIETARREGNEEILRLLML